MDFIRKQVISEEWVVQAWGKEIPLKAIIALTSPIVISVLLCLAYMIGLSNMQSLTMWAAFKSQTNPQGNFIPSTNETQKCYLTTSGMTVVWSCVNETAGCER